MTATPYLDQDRIAEAEEALRDLCTFPSASHQEHHWFAPSSTSTCTDTCPDRHECPECGDGVCSLHYSPIGTPWHCQQLGAIHATCHSLVCVTCPL